MLERLQLLQMNTKTGWNLSSYSSQNLSNGGFRGKIKPRGFGAVIPPTSPPHIPVCCSTFLPTQSSQRFCYSAFQVEPVSVHFKHLSVFHWLVLESLKISLNSNPTFNNFEDLFPILHDQKKNILCYYLSWRKESRFAPILWRVGVSLTSSFSCKHGLSIENSTNCPSPFTYATITFWELKMHTGVRE